MANQTFTYILHKDGTPDDCALELRAAAQGIAPEARHTAIVAGSGPGPDAVCQALSSYFEEIWKISHPDLSHHDAEVIRGVLKRILPGGEIVLIPHDHFGMDLSPGLSIKLNTSFISDVIAIETIENGILKAIREEFSGQARARMDLDITSGAVITIRPGSFKAFEDEKGQGRIVDKTDDALSQGPVQTGRRFLKTIEAEKGDVDITQSDVLASVGRGIEDEDNLDIIRDLADALGGDVSCSRPVVDAKWLEKARQVGSSGQTVKPKVYMALGISGSFQHLMGIKGNPFMVAINKNPRAPIFQVADVGVVADIVEFIPGLTNRINQLKG